MTLSLPFCRAGSWRLPAVNRHRRQLPWSPRKTIANSSPNALPNVPTALRHSPSWGGLCAVSSPSGNDPGCRNGLILLGARLTVFCVPAADLAYHSTGQDHLWQFVSALGRWPSGASAGADCTISSQRQPSRLPFAGQLSVWASKSLVIFR